MVKILLLRRTELLDRIIGEMHEGDGSRLACLYAGIDAPVLQVPLATASVIKYASNAFHALKIVFANELGVLCRSLGADSHAVMDVFCRDTKLNVSAAYLRPGFVSYCTHAMWRNTHLEAIAAQMSQMPPT